MAPPAKRGLSVVWKPLVVCPQPEFLRRLQAVLTQLEVEQPCTLTEYPGIGTVAALANRHACNICFLDAATNLELAQLLIAEIAPHVPVVVMYPLNDADLILRCLRRGASEFIGEPADEAIRGVFERLGRKLCDVPAPAAGAIYWVAPGKRGCGASTQAAHLAIQIRSDGANPVLLVDGDQLTASIAFMLKLKPEFHLEDVARDWSRMDDDLWSRLTVPAFGLEVLAAPEDPAARTEVNRQFAGELCSFWRERYKAVVLDLPDMRTAVDTGFASLADIVLLVTTNELAALQATSRGVRYLTSRAAGDPGKLRLILNRYTPSTGLKREEVATALALKPYAVLCNDYDAIQAALLEGQPVHAGSRYGSSVQDLCRQLTQKPAPERSKKASWLASLLRRPQLSSQ
jgi:Flp pilus assembly CpaE family ATPase